MVREDQRYVQTVLGPVAPEDLGRTLMHEHVLISSATYWKEPSDPADRALSRQPMSYELLSRVRDDPNLLLDNCELADLDLAAHEIAQVKIAGGMTIVDMSAMGLGRDPSGLAKISRSTGVHIVCGTGYYFAGSLPPDTDTDRSIEDLASEMIAEIREGIAGTSVKAGVIGEIGLSDPVNPFENRVLRAAVRAGAATGALIVGKSVV